MESFSADWLTLREPADHVARVEALVAALAARLAAPGASTRGVDLAAGTGSNVRYLLPRLTTITEWTLVDHDPALLAEATRRLAARADAHGRRFAVRQADLNDVAALPIDSAALVTASALLDLVAADWVWAFARRCREAGVAVLCTLTYDGRLECDPPDAFDARVRALVNAHQRTDKGFGRALGPDATDAAAAAFRAEGFDVTVATSDWVLDAAQAELQRQLIEGWAGAARDMAPDDAAAIDVWRDRRLAAVVSGASRVRVGHGDLLALLPTR
ncbi:MAG: class I SAM-dependent methyltransferase [Vicinamibacterales bacterium]